jgi:hypothetical protein
MKNKNIENLIKDIKKVSLTSAEKSSLSAKLNTYINEHAPSAKTLKSPYFSYFHFSKTFSYTFASLLVLIIAGGSALSSSARALPGDFLYPVKVRVAEPLRIALATTPEAKQEIEVARIEERLNEAEILAVQGRLATTTAVALQQKVENQIKSFEGNLNQKNQDNLDIKMSAHSIVLKNIKDNSGEDQKSRIADFETIVRKNNKQEEGNKSSEAARPTVMTARIIAPASATATVQVISEHDSERNQKIDKEVKDIDKKIEKRSGKEFKSKDNKQNRD